VKLYENIKNRRIALKLSQEELAKMAGYSSRSMIAKIEAGDIDLYQSKVEEIARALDTTPKALMGWSELSSNSPTMQRVLSRIPHFSTPVSAGDGEWLSEGHDYEWIEVEDAPKETDFALTVKGDSMSPVYNDGEIVYVKLHRLVESGEIGVFLLNGEGYLKKLQGTKLMSLNNAFPHIEVKESDSFYMAGKVVGKQNE
jgi:SOS-response transcriptional repressor LexA